MYSVTLKTDSGNSESQQHPNIKGAKHSGGTQEAHGSHVGGTWVAHWWRSGAAPEAYRRHTGGTWRSQVQRGRPGPPKSAFV